MFQTVIDNLIKPITDFIRKIHFNCKSRCCGDCLEISANIFQRSSTKFDFDKL